MRCGENAAAEGFSNGPAMLAQLARPPLFFVTHIRRPSRCVVAASPSPDDTPPPEEDQEKTKKKAKRRPMSQETKDKIAAARRGQRQSDETRSKIREKMSNRRISLSHRLRIAEGRKEKYHSEATRQAISDAVRSTKLRLKKERLADRAARAAVAATADLRFQSKTRPFAADDSSLILDMIELEKAVVEVTRLRDELTSWLDLYESKFGRKPDLTETSETHPQVYGRFVRYVALRDLVRRSSLETGKTPVVWG